jgi:hypothetical protein
MKEVTGAAPKIGGSSILGFGSYHYHYESGREGDWFLTGFSPRKQNPTIYITSGFNKWVDLLKKPGKHKTSVSCSYVDRLEDIDLSSSKKLISESVILMKQKHH